MKRTALILTGVLSLVCARAAQGQEVNVNRSNRTISVTVTETARAEAEVAVVQAGYRNFGRTKELAFEENVRTANKIVQALLDAGISKDRIETQNVRLERFNRYDEDSPADLRKERQFEAYQSWTIRVPVAEAQKVVDLAVAAGANSIEDVEWTVHDPLELEANANSAAVARARALAEKMAKESGAKLGELLYVSNAAFVRALGSLSGMAMTVTVSAAREPQLKLFPQKVEKTATVTAVFSME